MRIVSDRQEFDELPYHPSIASDDLAVPLGMLMRVEFDAMADILAP